MKRFRAPWWLSSCHLQTLWPALIRRAPGVRFQRRRIELDDGDFIDLDETPPATAEPVVLLLHGLEGSSSSPYIRGMASAIQSLGWQASVMHFRGCSGHPNRLPRTYHSGDTGDTAFVMQTLKREKPHSPLILVGFSLGGNVVLKLLGEQGVSTQAAAAVAVSVPMVLSECARRLESGFSRVYQRWLLKSLHGKFRLKLNLRDAPIDFKEVSKWRTFTASDHNVTAPLHGFSSATHYYTESSSRQYLKDIRVPTLIVQSRDDPFMTAAVLPQPGELSDFVRLEVSKTGGHVGFVQGAVPWRARYWLEERVPAFVKRSLAEDKNL